MQHLWAPLCESVSDAGDRAASLISAATGKSAANWQRGLDTVRHSGET